MNAPAEPSILQPLAQSQRWQASLALRVENREGRSVLARNQHYGPLRVQKALYPEGDSVCQILMLHPPAGIAGGDQLQIEVEVAANAHAQLTTPGAGKWYKARGVDQTLATQDITLSVAAGGKLEWLPQEVIVFDQAQAHATTTISLAEGARAIGWDILCLGRQASGEDFKTGSFRQRLRLQRPDGTPLWQETMHLQGADSAMRSPVGLNDNRVFGTLWLAGISPDAALTESLRTLAISSGIYGLSSLPQVTIIRAMSDSAEAIRQYFEAVWAMARPHVLQREAVAPRIWKT